MNNNKLSLFDQLLKSVKDKELLDNRYKNGSSLLHSAAEKGKLDFLNSLINIGADLNAQDDNGKLIGETKINSIEHFFFFLFRLDSITFCNES